MTKKIIIFLLALISVIGFSSCSGKESEKAVAGNSGDHMTITFGYYREELFGGEYNRETDPLIQYVEEKFNVTLEPQFVTWADAKEKYRLWAAAGEMPDFFATALDKATYFSWIKQGVLRALPEDLSSYPNIEKIMAQDDIEYLDVDGKYYQMPRLVSKSPNAGGTGLVYRKDWMAKVGMTQPENWAELVTMMEKFVTEDPDGNGKDDSIGIMLKSRKYWDVLMHEFNPYFNQKLWKNVDGQWTHYALLPETMEGVKALSNLYKNGVLYKDFPLMKEASIGVEKFCYGTAGVLTIQCDPPRIQQLKKSWEKYNPDKPFADYIGILDRAPFAETNGERYNPGIRSHWAADYFNGAVDDTKMARIMEILEFMHSQEGYDLWYRGLEGVDYNKTADGYEDLRPLDDEGKRISLVDKYPGIMLFGGLAYWGMDRVYYNQDEINYTRHDEDVVAMTRDYARIVDEETKLAPTSRGISEFAEDYLAKNKFGVQVADDVEACIMSADPEKAWNAVLAKYEKMGLSRLIQEVNDEIRNQGLE